MATVERSPNPPVTGPDAPGPPAPHSSAAGGVSVLAAMRHPHKLRLGHLRGNRFEVVLTGSATADDVAALRARFADAAANGVANFYGGERGGGRAGQTPRGPGPPPGGRREGGK